MRKPFPETSKRLSVGPTGQSCIYLQDLAARENTKVRMLAYPVSGIGRKLHHQGRRGLEMELSYDPAIPLLRVSGESSVQFSHSVMSSSLQLHEPQHARPPCPSPTPRVHPNPCLLIESVMPCNHLILCHPLFLLP